MLDPHFFASHEARHQEAQRAAEELARQQFLLNRRPNRPFARLRSLLARIVRLGRTGRPQFQPRVRASQRHSHA